MEMICQYVNIHAMSNFITKWHKLREEKQSNIVAGLDPAVFAIGRGEKGLPEGTDKLEWSLNYIEAVAPYVACIKPNAGYFGNAGDRTILKKIVDKTHELGLLALIDGKIADIGSTSDAWMYDYAELGFDALTIAPYAGNVEQMVKYAHEREMAVITMGLMSNPEYKTEMNFKDENGTSLWKSRVERGLAAGVDGLVVGGTYTVQDKEFMEFVDITKDSNALYLIPGIGFQGGEVQDFLASGIDKDRCMINSTRGLMFPNGSNSTPQEQAAAAKELRDDFNNVIN